MKCEERERNGGRRLPGQRLRETWLMRLLHLLLELALALISFASAAHHMATICARRTHRRFHPPTNHNVRTNALAFPLAQVNSRAPGSALGTTGGARCSTLRPGKEPAGSRSRRRRRSPISWAQTRWTRWSARESTRRRPRRRRLPARCPRRPGSSPWAPPAGKVVAGPGGRCRRRVLWRSPRRPSRPTAPPSSGR